MSKPKKTRQQKIITDLRKQLTIQTPPQETTKVQPHFSYSATPSLATHTTMSQLSSTHLAADLRKTVVLTLFLLAGELVLSILLRNHLITIPMVKF